MSAAITLKANAIMPAFIALVAAIPVSVLEHALEKPSVPRKIVHILLLTYRYVFVIEQEYQKMVRAIKTRGFIPKTSSMENGQIYYNGQSDMLQSHFHQHPGGIIAHHHR